MDNKVSSRLEGCHYNMSPFVPPVPYTYPSLIRNSLDSLHAIAFFFLSRALMRTGTGLGRGALWSIHRARSPLHQVQPGEADGAHQDLLVQMQRHEGLCAFLSVLFFFFVVRLWPLCE